MTIETFLTKFSTHTHLTNPPLRPTCKLKKFDREPGRPKTTPSPVVRDPATPSVDFFSPRGSLPTHAYPPSYWSARYLP